MNEPTVKKDIERQDDNRFVHVKTLMIINACLVIWVIIVSSFGLDQYFMIREGQVMEFMVFLYLSQTIVSMIGVISPRFHRENLRRYIMIYLVMQPLIWIVDYFVMMRIERSKKFFTAHACTISMVLFKYVYHEMTRERTFKEEMQHQSNDVKSYGYGMSKRYASSEILYSSFTVRYFIDQDVKREPNESFSTRDYMFLKSNKTYRFMRGKHIDVKTGIFIGLNGISPNLYMIRADLSKEHEMLSIDRNLCLSPKGEILVSVHNCGRESSEITRGQSVAILVNMSKLRINYIECEDVSEILKYQS